MPIASPFRATFSIPVDTNPNVFCDTFIGNPAPNWLFPTRYRITSPGVWMNLANGQRYLFAAPTADFPVFQPGTVVLPAGFCSPTPVDICECPTLVTVKFNCGGVNNPTAVSGGTWKGYVGTAEQASGTVAAGQSIQFLVRGDVTNYRVEFTTTTGSNAYTNIITTQSSVGPFNTVCEEKIEIDLDLCGDCPTCPTCTGEVEGNVDMIPEFEHQHQFGGFTYTRMIADNGPSGNFRFSYVPAGSFPPPRGVQTQKEPFLFVNLPTNGSSTYRVRGIMSFRVGNDFEYFETPHTTVIVPCLPTMGDLGDIFCMDRGVVKGAIKLCGPVPAPDCPPFFDYLFRHDAQDTAPLDGVPDNWSDLSNSSHVLATGHGTPPTGVTQSAIGGRARALFNGAANASGSSFLGSYELVLAGLNEKVKPQQAPSHWQANQLVLRFENPSSPFVEESITITDNQFPTPRLLSKNSSETNDHNYCFGAVTLTLNLSRPFHDPSITLTGGTTPTFGNFDCDGNPADYSVSGSASGSPQVIPASTGSIRLTLPAGTYTVTPRVQNGGGTSTLAPVTFTVGCGECIVVNPSLQVGLDDIPCVTESGDFLVSGTITNTNPVTDLTYALNGGTAVQVTPLLLPFTVPTTGLNQGVNTIKVEVTDDQGTIASSTRTFVFDTVPPVISGCRDIEVAVAPGQTSAVVNYNVSATDNVDADGTVSLICTPPSGSSLPLGATTVCCTATDKCGNESVCCFQVRVGCLALNDAQVECGVESGQYAYSFNFSHALPYAVHRLVLAPNSPCASISPSVIPLTPPLVAGASFPVVVTVNVQPSCPGPICFTVSAHGAEAEDCCTEERCLEIVAIRCPPDIVVECETGEGAEVSWDAITAVDIDGSPLPVDCSHEPGWFPVGITTVTCTAVDQCGNEITCEFTVCVRSEGPGAWKCALSDGVSPGVERGHAVAADRFGNVYHGGSFEVPRTVIDSMTLASAGGVDGFVAKRDGNCALVWACGIGGTGFDEVRGVATDSQGNVYVCGEFSAFAGMTVKGCTGSGKVKFAPTAGPNQDIFVAKFDAGGALLWARRAGGLLDDAAADLALAPNGDVLVTGNWGTTGGVPQCFLLRYTAGGILAAGPLLSTGGTGTAAVGTAVAADGSGVYVTGFYVGRPTFANLLLAPPATSAAFVAKADTSLGAGWIWNTSTAGPGATGNHDGRGIGVNPTNGDIFITGYFSGTASIPSALGLPPTVVTKVGSLYDYYVACLNPAGGAKWMVKGGGPPTSDDETRDLTVDSAGNIYVTGFRHANASSPFVSGGREVLVESREPGAGLLRWTRHASGPQPDNIGRSIAVDCAGCVYVTGDYIDQLNFPNPSFGPSVPAISNSSGENPNADLFLGKICPVCPCREGGNEGLSLNISSAWDQNAGTPLPTPTDPEWEIVLDQDPLTFEPRAATVVVGTGALPGSSWVGPGSQFGIWRMRYCFTLPADCTAQLSLQVAADSNLVTVSLNEIKIAMGQAYGAGPLTAASNNLLPGLNCIEIEINGVQSASVAGTVLTTDCGCRTIEGVKFNDLNRNGVRDPGEPGLQGWTILIKDSSGNVVTTAVTGANGGYSVPHLFPGVYTVCEVHKGWFNSTPLCQTVTVLPNQPGVPVDFGNYDPQVVVFDPTIIWGIRHFPIGGAGLAENPGGLVVTNVGDSGEDGVRLELGRAQGWSLMWEPIDAEMLPDGAYVDLVSQGSLNGQPDQFLGNIHVEDIGSVFQVSFDFARLGAGTYTVKILKDGVVVDELAGVSGAGVTLAAAVCGPKDPGPSTPPLNPCTPPCPPLDLVISTGTPTMITIPGHGAVFGDTVIAQPEFAGVEAPTIEYRQSVFLRIKNIPALELMEEKIVVFEKFVSSLGAAHLTAGESALVVSNIGSSGQDGVTVDLGRAGSALIHLDPIDPGGLAPTGAFIQASARGSISLIPDQPLGFLRVSKTGTGYEMMPDFTPIASPTQHLQLFRKGALIVDIAGHLGPVLASTWPSIIGNRGGSVVSIASIHPDGTVFKIDAIDYVGDELRLVAESTEAVTDYKSSLAISAAGIPEFAITGMSVAQIQEVFSQDFENGLGLNESVFGAFSINNIHTALNNGTRMMGHAAPYGALGGAATPLPSYSYYELTVDLAGIVGAELRFDLTGGIEKNFDGFNVLASTGAINPPNGLLFPAAPSKLQYGNLIVHPDSSPELGPIAWFSPAAPSVVASVGAVFDLSAFDGQRVTLRFQFGTDALDGGDGVNLDNISIIGLPAGAVSPMDPTFKVTSIVRTLNGVAITWESVNGKDYGIEYSRTLNSWTEIAVKSATGAETSFTDQEAARVGLSEGFYRIREK